MATVSDPRFDTKDPRFDPESDQPAPPPAARSPWTTCLVGCLVVAGVAVLLSALAAYWIWQNWRDLAATGATEALNQVIDTTDLPAEEQREMKVEVRRVADAFREGELSNDQLRQIVGEVVNSPLLTVFVVSAVEKQYFDKSGLGEEEKAEGRQSLRRFVRGAVDGKIDQAAVDSVMSHVAVKQGDQNWRLRERVTDAELRAALSEAKQAADAAEVPEQPESIDASAELKRIVDESMGAEKRVDE
jgi:hypothetical protein